LDDVDNIIIVANDDTQFDKIIQLMDRAKEAGFSKINLAKLGG
jgi:biopolymer transport protein ExbD